MFFFFSLIFVTAPVCFSAQGWMLCQAVPVQPLFSVLPVSFVPHRSHLQEPVLFLQKTSPHQREDKFALLSRSCSAPAFVWTCPLNPRDIKGFPHVMEAPWPALKRNNGSPIFWDLCSKCLCLANGARPFLP